jgi:hypothetical protein
MFAVRADNPRRAGRRAASPLLRHVAAVLALVLASLWAPLPAGAAAPLGSRNFTPPGYAPDYFSNESGPFHTVPSEPRYVAPVAPVAAPVRYAAPAATAGYYAVPAAPVRYAAPAAAAPARYYAVPAAPVRYATAAVSTARSVAATAVRYAIPAAEAATAPPARYRRVAYASASHRRVSERPSFGRRASHSESRVASRREFARHPVRAQAPIHAERRQSLTRVARGEPAAAARPHHQVQAAVVARRHPSVRAVRGRL